MKTEWKEILASRQVKMGAIGFSGVGVLMATVYLLLNAQPQTEVYLSTQAAVAPKVQTQAALTVPTIPFLVSTPTKSGAKTPKDGKTPDKPAKPVSKFVNPFVPFKADLPATVEATTLGGTQPNYTPAANTGSGTTPRPSATPNTMPIVVRPSATGVANTTCAPCKVGQATVPSGQVMPIRVAPLPSRRSPVVVTAKSLPVIKAPVRKPSATITVVQGGKRVVVAKTPSNKPSKTPAKVVGKPSKTPTKVVAKPSKTPAKVVAKPSSKPIMVTMIKNGKPILVPKASLGKPIVVAGKSTPLPKVNVPGKNGASVPGVGVKVAAVKTPLPRLLGEPDDMPLVGVLSVPERMAAGANGGVPSLETPAVPSGTGSNSSLITDTSAPVDPNATTDTTAATTTTTSTTSTSNTDLLGVPAENDLLRYTRTQNVRFTSVVLGPINTAIFETNNGFVVVALGQSLPNTNILVSAISEQQATLQLGQDKLELNLDRR